MERETDVHDMAEATRRRRGGQVLVLFAVAMVVLVIMCALTADVGRMVTSQAELQNAVDAAALAGASQLHGFVGEAEKTAARQLALQLADVNLVANEGLTLASGDITFGRYLPGQAVCFESEAQMGAGGIIDSIRVQGRRTTDAPDGPISLFFASIFGMHASGQAVRAVATQPRRYVAFVMDRSGSMCFDTTNITHKYAPNSDGTMAKSPTGWYWMSRVMYVYGSWRTAWFYATDDSTGDTVSSFLPEHIRTRMDGNYFRYCERDQPNTVQSGWLYAPANVTIHSRYGATYPSWSADSYGPIGSCDYAYANNPIEPIASSQNAACAFVDLLNAERDRAALITYGWNSVLDHPLTDDWSALKTTIASYDPRGATGTPAGMDKANDEFIDSGRATGYGQRVMILLTDGLANTVNGSYYSNPYSMTPVTFFGQSVSCYIYQTVATAIEAQTLRARNNGIRIYTVSFGSGADQSLMPLIASKTRGAYYYAADYADLTAVFVDIFHNLPPILTH